MTEIAHEDLIRDYVNSPAYEKAFKEKELLESILHLRHYRDKSFRKAWLSHAREADRLAAASLDSASEKRDNCPPRVVLVGPELAGSGMSVPERVVSLAHDLHAMGCGVELVTRLLPKSLPLDFTQAVSQVRFVRPLQSYASLVEKGSGPVVTFWLPLSVSLQSNRIRHVCVWDAGETKLCDGDTFAGQDAALVGHLALLPDAVLGESKLPSSGRRVLPVSAPGLVSLMAAEFPPLPRFQRVPTVSACMIAKDEEGTIDGCLQSLVPCVDQVVVNDTGSTDNTPEIAEAYGAEVIRTKWQDDFSIARNASLEAAKCDFILVIDADERVSESSRSLLKEAATRGCDAYLVNIANQLEGSTKMAPIVRLLRNLPHHRYVGAVHEQVAQFVKGRTGLTDIILDHLGYGAAVSEVKSKRGRNISLLLKERENLKSESERGYSYLAFQAGVEMLLSGNPVDALALLSEAVEKAPVQSVFRPAAVLRICQALVAMGRVSDAEAHAKAAVKEYPGFLDIAEVAATALIERKDYQAAADLLDETVRGKPSPLLPKTDGADTFILSTLRAMVALGLGDAETAFTWVNKALEQKPDYADAQKLLALHWADRVPDTLRKVRTTTSRPAVHALLAMNRPELAREAALAIADQGSLGEVALASKDFAAARDHFAGSEDSWDRDRAAILDRCLAGESSRAGIGKTPLSRVAEKVLSGQAVFAGEVRDALKFLGFLLDIGLYDRFTSAVGCLEKFPTGEILAGRLLYERGLLDMAEEYLMRRKSDTPECMSMLADIFYRKKRYAEAANYYRSLAQSRHLNPKEAFSLADSLVRCGDFKGVAEVVSEARSLYPEDVPLKRLSEVLRRSPLFKGYDLA